MHLHQFIDEHMDEIVAEWVSFARTLDSSTEEMSLVQLRDHAEAMLRSVASDIDRHQSGRAQYEKSRGKSDDAGNEPSPASIHGTQRYQNNFTLLHLSAEFRALRATVLRLWLPRVGVLSAETIQEMIRFNEGIDQALAESIVTYSARSDQTRELFLAILGHDLRAPLATMTAAAQLLARPALAAGDVVEIGARVRRSARVMSRLVDDLIGYTRTELGSGMPVSLEVSDLREVCLSAIEDAQSTSPDTQFELSAEGPLGGMFDSARLHQLFTNLLVNAAKYGTSNDPVRVRLAGSAEMIRVDVTNRGPTIPRSEWQNIFQPLVQLSGTSSGSLTEQGTSLGLGLFVAREIAKLHGGSIEVHSTIEAGTTFTVCLPQAGLPPT